MQNFGNGDGENCQFVGSNGQNTPKNREIRAFDEQNDAICGDDFAARRLPVAVVDSGVGGISVLRELRRVMPYEDFLYLGDSANAPYGSRDRGEVLDIMRRNLQMLLARGIKALVIACNTATSAAAATLRAEYPNLPIVGIEPAIKPATLVCDSPRVLVMATPLTLREEKFRALAERFADREEIIPLPCCGLVELIESGDLDGAAIHQYLRDLLAPFADQKIDAVVLGCTHYPHVRHLIGQYAPRGAVILDGGEGTAKETLRRLTAANLCAPCEREGRVEILNSSNDPRLITLSHTLLEREF